MSTLDQPFSSPSLAIVILTYNETLHLDRALQHVADIAREIFVIDSFSTDDTVEIARKRGATVLQNRFINYAKQFQWGLENAPITADWVMRLDADELIEPDLAAEIAARLPLLPPNVSGVNLRRKTIFLNRWIKHGGRFPLTLVRIWRRGQAHIEDRWMDEHMVLSGGKTVEFRGGFSDWNLNGLTFFTDKHNKYATREAIDVINHRRSPFAKVEELPSEAGSSQASYKRFIKEKIYNNIPFEIAAVLYFVQRYFFQLGFLDGREGLLYHALQGFWYRLLVGAKVREFEENLVGTSDPEKIKAILRNMAQLEL